jgi:hypothetical protein
VKILFYFDNSIVKTQYEPQDKLDLAITNDKSKAIDSVIYYINDKQVGSGIERLTYSLKPKARLPILKSTCVL